MLKPKSYSLDTARLTAISFLLIQALALSPDAFACRPGEARNYSDVDKAYICSSPAGAKNPITPYKDSDQGAVAATKPAAFDSSIDGSTPGSAMNGNTATSSGGQTTSSGFGGVGSDQGTASGKNLYGGETTRSGFGGVGTDQGITSGQGLIANSPNATTHIDAQSNSGFGNTPYVSPAGVGAGVAATEGAAISSGDLTREQQRMPTGGEGTTPVVTGSGGDPETPVGQGLGAGAVVGAGSPPAAGTTDPDKRSQITQSVETGGADDRLQGGGTASISGGIPQQNGNGNGNGNANQANNASDSNDSCKNSAAAGLSICNGSTRYMKNMDAANTLMQQVGSSVVQTAGQLGAMKAQQSGAISATYSAAAESTKLAAENQLTTGIANIAMGYIASFQKAKTHEDAQKDMNAVAKSYSNNLIIQDAATAKAETYKDTLNKANGGININDYTNPALAAHSQRAIASATVTARRAAGEQEDMAGQLNDKGMFAIVQGTLMTLQGTMGMAIANQQAKLAQNIGTTAGGTYQLSNADVTGANNGTPTTTSVSTGTSTDPAVSSTDGSLNNPGAMPSLTPAMNPDTPSSGGGAGPTAGQFAAGSPPGGGGAAGNPAIGVGSMNAAKDDAPAQGPKMADNRQNTAYSSGSAGYAAGAGGGSSADKSGDLGFLANLLPNAKEEAAKNGILDYGNGGRSPASAAPYSFLGRDVNIFQRVSDRTVAKFKNGDIGG